MEMKKTIKRIYQINAANTVNSFIYFLKKLWLIGKLIPDSLYEDTSLKVGLSVFAVIVKQLLELMGKVLYVLIMVAAPILIAKESGIGDSQNYTPYVIHILFVLSCILGPIEDSNIFKASQNKYLCLKYLKMNPKHYVHASLITRYVPFFLYFLPVVVLTVLIAGGSFLDGFLFWTVMICFRIMGEAFQLFLYKRKNYVFSRKIGMVWMTIFLGIIVAYYPLFMKNPWMVSQIVLHPITIVLCEILLLCSLYYIVFGYKEYGTKYLRSIDTKYFNSEIKMQAKQNAFKDVALKESDLQEELDKKEGYENLKGYHFLNAIFFARHRRQLTKPVYYRLGIIAIVFAVLMAISVILPEAALVMRKNISRVVPSLVFVMYLASTAGKSTRAMFYNCDISLLRYGFYRSPQTILSNFRIRLIRISLHNLIVAGALSLAVLVFCLAGGTRWVTPDLWMFVGAALLLSIFFTVHNLFLYYVFQPYSTELDIKNPFFKIINSVIYVLSYACFQIEAASAAFTVGVLIFTLIYIIVALALVYKFAPRKFRVK